MPRASIKSKFGRIKIGSGSMFSRSAAARINRVKALRAIGPLARTGGRMPVSNRVLRTGEKKNIDVTTNASSNFNLATTTGTLVLLNGVAQGTTAVTRLGRKIIMSSLLIRLAMWKPATMTQESPVRILIFYDSQANAAAPAATDILATDAITGVTNLNNAERFSILLDKEFHFGSVTDTTIVFKKFLKLNKDVVFNSGSAGTVGDIQTGSVYMLSYCPNLGVATPQGQIVTRVRFTDN